jgi:hypothetical protein
MIPSNKINDYDTKVVVPHDKHTKFCALGSFSSCIEKGSRGGAVHFAASRRSLGRANISMCG